MYEAAARHNSFKKAAAELNVTPSAVSQQVKALEGYVDEALFDRSERQYKLTDAGQLYYAIAKDIINSHSKGYEEFRQYLKRPLFRVSTPLIIAQELLIPNYESFHTLDRQADLRIITGMDYVNFDTESFDAAIRLGDGEWPGLSAQWLCDIDMCLVCSPSYLEKHNLSAEDVFELQTLNDHLLLSIKEDASDWMRLIPGVEPKDKVVFDSYASIVKSATQGLGIAYGMLPLIKPWLDEQSLVRLNAQSLDSSAAYWLVAPESSKKQAAVDRFYQWSRSLFSEL